METGLLVWYISTYSASWTVFTHPELDWQPGVNFSNISSSTCVFRNHCPLTMIRHGKGLGTSKPGSQARIRKMTKTMTKMLAALHEQIEYCFL